MQVTGHRAYRDDGELRMTTVYVSTPQEDVTLPRAAARAYVDPDAAVVAALVGLRARRDDESSDRESSVSRWSPPRTPRSPAALTELGEDVSPIVEVLDVTPGLPAEGARSRCAT